MCYLTRIAEGIAFVSQLCYNRRGNIPILQKCVEKERVIMSKQNHSIVDSPHSPWMTIILLAWPILVEQVLTSLVHAVDTAMVGSLGKVATASVAISQSPNMLINGVIMALGVGFTSLIARSVGAKNMERARGLLRQAILTVIALGIPATLLCFGLSRKIPIWMGGAPEILDSAEIYNKIIALSLIFRCMTMVLTAIYRGYGDSKTPMKVNIMVNLINVVGNFLLIFPSRQINFLGMEIPMWGMGWGVAGAAASTSASAALGGVIMLSRCFTVKNDMRISLKESFAPDWQELKVVVRLGLPAMVQRAVMTSASIIVTSTVATLGTAAVAAQSLSGTAESLSFMPGFAFGQAITTLYGQSLGAGKPEKAEDFLWKTVKMGSVVMAVMTCVLFFGSRLIMGIFTPDEEVIAMGSELLKILAMIQIPQNIASCISGALQGAGDTKTPLFVTLFSMWGVRILGILICVRAMGMGINAVCVCMCSDNVVRCLLFLAQYFRKREKLATEAMAAVGVTRA